MDPNFHLRHSVYYDFAATARVEFLSAHGLSTHLMLEQHVGPILFREEAIFRKEVRPGDQLPAEMPVKVPVALPAVCVMVQVASTPLLPATPVPSAAAATV